jgi:flagellar motility protein MotE (MotC chaperone)
MKNLILVIVTGGVLFGLSAGVSYFLRGSASAEPQAASALEDNPDGDTVAPAGRVKRQGSAPGFSGQAGGADAVPARVKYVPEAEVAVHIANSLREREAAVKKHEEQLVNRESSLEMVFKDIRGERAVVDELRKQVFDELKGVEKQMAAVRQEFTKLDEEKQRVEQRVADLEGRVVELQGVEHTNIKKMAEAYGLMEAEKAAKIIVDMVENGKTDTAIKIIGLMTQRQAAKLFAELPQHLAGDLMEKLKGFKPEKPAAKK